MAFRVPWRCLIPEDAVEGIFGEDGGRACSEATGAQVQVSTESEKPETLSDVIVSLEGPAPQKEGACRFLVQRLWQSQGIPPDEEGILVLVVPSKVVGAIIGTKGAKVNEIMSTSGADLNVGRECIIGMPDNPVVVRGTQEQVLQAVSMAYDVLQQLADRGRLQPEDCVYTPGREAPSLPPRGPYGATARLRFNSSVAGFVIGKAGARVKRLKEESGAQLQFKNADEEPSLAEDERVLEVRGGPAQRELALRGLWQALDEMPNPPGSTQLLVPAALDPTALREAASAASLSVVNGARLGGTEPGEVAVTLEGAAPARLEATLAILALTDARSDGPGSAPPPGMDGPPRRPPAAETPAKAPDDRARHPAYSAAVAADGPAAAPAAAPAAQEIEEQREEPESGKVYTLKEFKVAFAGTYTESEIMDYWRDACKPVLPTIQEEPAPVAAEPAREEEEQWEQQRRREDEERLQQQQQQQQQRLEQQRRQREEEQQQLEQQRRQREEQMREEQQREGQRRQREEQQREDQQRRLREEQEQQRREREEQLQREEQQRRQREDQERRQREEEQRLLEQREQQEHREQQQRRQVGQLEQQPCSSQQMANKAAQPRPQMPCSAPLFGSFAPFCARHPNAGQGGWNGDAPFSAQLAQLQLLLPADAIRQELVPSGQMAQIARGCNVHIDLYDDVQPGQLRLVFSGTCVANALATLALQGRLWLAGRAN